MLKNKKLDKLKGFFLGLPVWFFGLLSTILPWAMMQANKFMITFLLMFAIIFSPFLFIIGVITYSTPIWIELACGYDIMTNIIFIILNFVILYRYRLIDDWSQEKI